MTLQSETRYPNKLLYGFIAVTAIFFIGMVCLAYLADSALTGPLSPAEAASRYTLFTGYMNWLNMAGFVIMLVYSNVYFLKKQQGGLLFIVTFILSALFANLYFAYLSETYFHFKKKTGLWEGGFSLAPFFGFIITAGILALVVTNYVILKKLLRERRI
jgi:hypothetical protein